MSAHTSDLAIASPYAGRARRRHGDRGIPVRRPHLPVIAPRHRPHRIPGRR
ncbi:hypothetical protein [Micromonospora globbae]|uniref:hypothetical protein n=1 Tax=Micromonospora globbae TaxID=1894969 RepID=UPI0037B91528